MVHHNSNKIQMICVLIFMVNLMEVSNALMLLRTTRNCPSYYWSPITSQKSTGAISSMVLYNSPSQEEQEEDVQKIISSSSYSRRSLLKTATAAAAAGVSLLSLPQQAFADTTITSPSSSSSSVYKPAKRPTAYRVDSTQPPTLIALNTAREQTKILKDLASGSGTDKDAIVIDSVNLNNVLNKAVFGTATALSSQFKQDESKQGVGYASFVCLGLPFQTTSTDVELATSLLSNIVSARPKKGGAPTALGLSWAPLSTQPALEQYTQDKDYAALTSAMKTAGVSEAVLDLYQPLLTSLVVSSSSSAPPAVMVDLLALSPEYDDLKTAQSQGLQQVNPERRSQYVVDAQGFISLTQQPQFQMYTDRSLFKDLPDGSGSGSATTTIKPGDFFAMSILKHEAAATACAQYAKLHTASTNAATPLVALVAPIPDVRFLVGGINGRIPRICQYLGLSKVTNDAVTTILCNPTAQETLSKSRYLRLEIGTGPETIDLQAKVADYLWFSAPPKVNMIPRLMDG